MMGQSLGLLRPIALLLANDLHVGMKQELQFKLGNLE